MPSEPLAFAISRLSDLLDEGARAYFDDFACRIDERGMDAVAERLAALPRRLGRAPLPRERVELDGAVFDADSFRACDLAAAVLLSRAGAIDDPAIIDTFLHGDAEEKRMCLRALTFLPPGAWSARLIEEAHRQNDEMIFLAGYADSDTAARILDTDAYNRGVLKAAFMDVEPSRLIGADRRANTTLSRMLLDFMTEREAAGRPIWPGSLELAALAPAPGVVERIVGDLWHGVDRRRLAAARGARLLGDVPAIRESCRARIQRGEPVEAIQRILFEVAGAD